MTLTESERRESENNSVIFDGFTLERIDVGEVELRVRHGGVGPPLLLLHGHPRTHVTWHRVAPLLAKKYTVICPDLRGYGESSKPLTTADHEPYSKRAMARDCIALMHALGFQTFFVAGHDRGCYVASRMALDYPQAVIGLIVMEGIPIAEALSRCDAIFAKDWYHWFFLAQPFPRPERVILADPDSWYTDTPEHMGMEAFDDVWRARRNPSTVHAMCEDYRAGLGLDREHDEADREAGRRIACPTLFLWAELDDLPSLYGDPLAIWRLWAQDVRGRGMHCGHHLAEEAPDELAQEIDNFLRRLI